AVCIVPLRDSSGQRSSHWLRPGIAELLQIVQLRLARPCRFSSFLPPRLALLQALRGHPLDEAPAVPATRTRTMAPLTWAPLRPVDGPTAGAGQCPCWSNCKGLAKIKLAHPDGKLLANPARRNGHGTHGLTQVAVHRDSAIASGQCPTAVDGPHRQ